MAISRAVKPALAGSALALVIPLVAHYEGLRTEAYIDAVGILTVCYGHTANVKPSDTYTKEQCEEKLVADIMSHAADLQFCTPSFDSLAEGQKAALVSWTYNVGASAACGSTLVRKLNAGEDGWCDELLRWRYARGVELPGLVKRREEEHRFCTGVSV